jgi:hypothetical protein
LLLTDDLKPGARVRVRLALPGSPDVTVSGTVLHVLGNDVIVALDVVFDGRDQVAVSLAEVSRLRTDDR